LKLCIDAGHGGKSPGAVGKYSQEKNITLNLALKLQEKLERSGIQVIMTRIDDIYLELQERCDIANKNSCDYFISIHCNSFSNTAVTGTETYYYRGSKEGLELAKAVQIAAIKYSKNKDRGVKTVDFYVLKYTKMPAILLEAAFISNESEENMMNDSNWQDGFTRSIAIAICDYMGIKPKVDDVLYTEVNPISDIRRATFEQMESFAHRINPNAPYLAKQYLSIGVEEGIRGDIAYAQAIKETGYFRFTGDVKIEQNNFAGLGSTGPGVKGASFTTVEDGIRAHIQHLKAYANTEPLKTDIVDPRFNLVKRGSAPNFEDLNGKWAVQEGYGQSIVSIWRRMLDE